MKRYEVLFSGFLMTAPLFKIYGFFTASVTLADVLLVIFLAVGLFGLIREKRFRVNWMILFYAGFVALQFLLVSLFNQTEEFSLGDVLPRTLRYVFFLTALAILTPNFFRRETAESVMTAVAVFATAYLFLQRGILAVTGWYLPGYLPGLPLTRPEMAQHARALFQYDPRPRSIFEEPSHYAFYVLLVMGMILGQETGRKRRGWLLLFLSLGIILSASSTGIIAMGALYAVWLFFSSGTISTGKKKKRFWAAALVAAPVFGAVLWQIPAFQVFLQRMAKGASSAQHLGAYAALVKLRQNVFSTLLGNGMIDTTTYGFLPAYCRLYYYYGILGLLGGMVLLMYMAQKSRREYRYMGLLFLILCVSGTELFGIQIFLIFPFLMEHPKTEKVRSLALESSVN